MKQHIFDSDATQIRSWLRMYNGHLTVCDLLLWRLAMWVTKGLTKTDTWKLARGDDRMPYLFRVYVARPAAKWGIEWPHVYLHFFFRGDLDRGLHNHPWRRMGSLILTGGYVEERLRINGPHTWGLYKPGSVNVIRRSDFHKVTLRRVGCWTLFVSQGRPKRNRAWGFFDPNTKQFEHADVRAERKKQERLRAEARAALRDSLRVVAGGKR